MLFFWKQYIMVNLFDKATIKIIISISVQT